MVIYAQHGEGFDAPPTLEHSGSEHRRAVTSSRPRGKRGLVRKVEPSLMVKKDGIILEKPPFGQRETEGFEKYHLNIFWKKSF